MSGDQWDPANFKIEARVVGRAKLRPERELTFENATVRGEDFSGRKLDYFGVTNSTFESCRFDRVRLKHCSFGSGRKQSVYRDCSFDGAKLRMGIGGHYRFERCSFRDVDLWEWFCFEVEIVDCVFTGKLRGVVFNGRVQDSAYDPLKDEEYDPRVLLGRERNEFHGNDFSGAELLDVGFRTGIDLTKQRLPSGPDYLYIPDGERTFHRARSEAIGLKNLEVRQVVLRWLDSRLDEVREGQNQFLFRPKDYYGFGGMKRDVLDAYFGLLRRYVE